MAPPEGPQHLQSSIRCLTTFVGRSDQPVQHPAHVRDDAASGGRDALKEVAQSLTFTGHQPMGESDELPRKIVLSREELYARIWAQPMAVVAPTLWISDVGLRGRCLGMKIPVPPRGYWARKNAGKRVQQPPLPPLDARSASAYGVTEFIRPMSARSSEGAPDDSPIAAQRRFEARPENRIIVADYAADPHPLVAETMHRYRRAKASPYNGTLQAERGPCLSLNVTAATLPRTLGILNALLVALDVRGYTTRIEMDAGHPHTVITVGTERVSMQIEEVIEHVEQPAPPPKRGARFGDWQPPERVAVATGRLILRLAHADASAHRRSWSDCSLGQLEDRLHAIVLGVVEVAHDIASTRRYEEDRAIRQRDEEIRSYDAYRRRAREEARVKALQALSARWHESQELRTYLDAVRAAMRADDNATKDAELLEWLAWADGYVTRLDPLAARIEFPVNAFNRPVSP